MWAKATRERSIGATGASSGHGPLAIPLDPSHPAALLQQLSGFDNMQKNRLGPWMCCVAAVQQNTEHLKSFCPLEDRLCMFFYPCRCLVLHIQHMTLEPISWNIAVAPSIFAILQRSQADWNITIWQIDLTVRYAFFTVNSFSHP